MVVFAFETLLSVTSQQLLSGDQQFRFSLTTGECALGLPLDLRQTVTDTRRAALAKGEVCKCFQPAKFCFSRRYPPACLGASQDRRSCVWRLASSTLASSWC